MSGKGQAGYHSCALILVRDACTAAFLCELAHSYFPPGVDASFHHMDIKLLHRRLVRPYHLRD